MGRPLRLLYLITTFSMGGAERHLYDLVSRLPRDDYRVAVAFFEERAEEAQSMIPSFEALGVEIVDLRMTSLRDLTALVRLVRLVQRWKPDIIHAHLYRAELLAVIVGRLFRVSGVICTLHNVDLYRYSWPLKRLLAMAYRFSDRVITVFKAEAVRLVERYNVPASRVVSIYHGFDSTLEPQEEAGLPYFREGRGPVVGTIARLSRQKGHPVLLEAFAEVQKLFPEAHLLVGGDDAEGLRPSLDALASRLGVSDAVTYSGYVDDVGSFLRKLDIFVLSSDYEGFPLVLLEAMFAGLPVVSTRVGGVPEVIEEDVTGILVPAQNPQALARGIIKLLNSPEEALRMRERGRNLVLGKFGMDRMLESTCQVYSDVARVKGLVG